MSVLRQKIAQRVSKDAQGVIQALKSAGVKLSTDEEAGISQGSIDQFSDVQLGERFNSKVLGVMGIDVPKSEVQGKKGIVQKSELSEWEKKVE